MWKIVNYIREYSPNSIIIIINVYFQYQSRWSNGRAFSKLKIITKKKNNGTIIV